jgi:hypothetical protein
MLVASWQAFSGAVVCGQTFSFDDWALGCDVFDNSSSGHDSASFHSVPNPFVDWHLASFSNSSAYASYNFAWDDQFGTFSIESSQQAQGGSSAGFLTRSSSRILLTPSVDLLFSVEGAFDYDLPADFMMAVFSFDIWDPVEGVDLFSDGQMGETFPGQPSSGTLLLEGSGAVIPAGHTYELSYMMMLYTFGGTQGYMATGEGGLTFTLTALPEPATLVLLAPALLAASSPRRSR